MPGSDGGHSGWGLESWTWRKYRGELVLPRHVAWLLESRWSESVSRIRPPVLLKPACLLLCPPSKRSKEASRESRSNTRQRSEGRCLMPFTSSHPPRLMRQTCLPIVRWFCFRAALIQNSLLIHVSLSYPSLHFLCWEFSCASSLLGRSYHCFNPLRSLGSFPVSPRLSLPATVVAPRIYFPCRNFSSCLSFTPPNPTQPVLFHAAVNVLSNLSPSLSTENAWTEPPVYQLVACSWSHPRPAYRLPAVSRWP